MRKAMGTWVRPYIDAQILKRRRGACALLLEDRPDLAGLHALWPTSSSRG